MRTSSVSVVLSVLLLAACGGDPPPVAEAPPTPSVAVATPPPPVEAPKKADPPPAPKPTMAELQGKAMKNLTDSFNDGKAYSANFAEDGLVMFPGMPEAKGRDAIAKAHQGFADGFADLKIGWTRTFTKGNVIVSEWVAAGTNSKDMMGVKASNKPVGLNGATVTWFNDDGLIKEMHLYVDTVTMMGQVGAMKQKVRAVAALPASTDAKNSKGGGDEDKNLELAKGTYAALDAKKEADFLATVDDAAEYDDFTQPTTFKGKADAKKFFQMWTKAIPDQKNAITNQWAFEDYVVTEFNTTGTQKGPIGPIKATGKPVNLHGVDIMKFANGKMVHGATYANGSELMGQLGMLPKPPAEGKPAATPAKPAGTTAPAATPAKPATTPAKPAPAAAKPPVPAKK